MENEFGKWLEGEGENDEGFNRYDNEGDINYYGDDSDDSDDSDYEDCEDDEGGEDNEDQEKLKPHINDGSDSEDSAGNSDSDVECGKTWTPGITTDGDFAPFPNATHALFFFLKVSHSLSRKLYQAIVSIIAHEQFVQKDIPSFDDLKKSRKFLPLLPIKKLKVTNKKGKAKIIRHYDFKSLIERLLSFPTLRNFNIIPKKPKKESDIFHGSLARENPLFNKLSPVSVDKGFFFFFFFFFFKKKVIEENKN